MQQRAARERWSLAGAALAKALQGTPGAAASQAQPLPTPSVLAAGRPPAPHMGAPASRDSEQAASAQDGVAAEAGRLIADCTGMPVNRAHGLDAAAGTSAAAAGHAAAQRSSTPAHHVRDDSALCDSRTAADHADAQSDGGSDARHMSPVRMSSATEPVAYAISVASAFSSPERQPLTSTLAAYEEGGGASPAHALPAASPEGCGAASASSPERTLPALSLAAPGAGRRCQPSARHYRCEHAQCCRTWCVRWGRRCQAREEAPAIAS